MAPVPIAARRTALAKLFVGYKEGDFMKAFSIIGCALLLMICVPCCSYAECSSDFDCGIGSRCVKAPLQSSGRCMKSVDEYGTPTYDLPRTDSVGPNMNLGGDCDFDTDCPIGFRCHRKYKVCVKR